MQTTRIGRAHPWWPSYSLHPVGTAEIRWKATAYVAYWFAWAAFYPETELCEAQ